MEPDAAKYLWDALRASQRIARFTADRDFAGYEADDMLRAAVERQFEIIGEASSASAALIQPLRNDCRASQDRGVPQRSDPWLRDRR